MIISHTHKFILIKSEKTAGTSIESALSYYCSGNDVVTPLGDFGFNRTENGEWIHNSLNAGNFDQHDDALTIKKKVSADVWKNYLKISMTRNPWDRVVSDFFWQKRQDPTLKPKKHFYHFLGVPFDELSLTKNMFTRFVKEGEWDTNDRFYIIDNELCVDYVIHYENLYHDLYEVCNRLGLPQLELPQLKSGIRKRNHHYSEYYDKETRAIVADRHKNDIRLFGYRFETS